MRTNDDAPAPKPTESVRQTAGLASLFFDPAVARNEATRIKGNMLEYAVVACVVIFLAGYEWLRRWVGLPQPLWWMTMFAVAIAGYCAVRVGLLRRRLLALQAGDRMWQAMHVDLDSLGEKGFYLFDGLVDGTGLILGPVLAGPTGIFSLNIRSNPRTGRLFEKVEHVDSRTLRIAGRPAMADPLGQARQAAERVRCLLEDRGVTGLAVTPLLIYPGWNLSRPPPPSERDVIVANEKTLAPEVMSGPPRLEPKQLIPVCEAFATMRRAG
jgi:hypothetical protein